MYNLEEVCLEITDNCPLSCLHCSGECDLASKTILNLSQIKRIISDFSILGGRILEISGGEPLIYPQLPQIIRYATSKGLEVILYTSGNMLTANGKLTSINEKSIRKLLRAGLKKIVFNVQGANADTHESITQVKGSFENVIKSIKITKILGLWIGVHFVPMKPNFKEFKQLLKLCDKLGVDEIGVLRFVAQGRGEKNKDLLKLSKEDFREFIRELSELTLVQRNPYIRVGRPIDFRCLFNPYIVKPVCNAGITKCSIGPDGKVVPCPAFKQNDAYVAGDVTRESLINIWVRSPIWLAFRRFDYTQLNEPCKGCKYLHQCRGGCIAQRLWIYEDIYEAPDPDCFRLVTPVKARAASSVVIRK